MRTQNVLLSLVYLPVVLVALRAVAAARLVRSFYSLEIVLWEALRERRLRDEERVVRVSSRVLLRLEERVEVPEAVLDVVVCRHFCESKIGQLFHYICFSYIVFQINLPHF